MLGAKEKYRDAYCVAADKCEVRGIDQFRSIDQQKFLFGGTFLN